MNKELEALQKLRDLVENLTRIDYVPADLRNEVKELLVKSYEDSDGYFWQIEVALNELECANHNYNALKEFYNNAVAYGTKIQKELNELKKRNEPMKVINGTTVSGVCLDYECPSCKQEIDNSRYGKDQHYLIKYCISCGQKLAWSDEN